MTSFDPSTFLDQEVDEPLSTQMRPVPEGEYKALIDSFGENAPVREVNTKNGPRLILRVPYVIQDAELARILERDTVRVYQDLWLDVDSSGKLITGGDSNVRLGQLRAALNQNEVGKPWSFKMLQGAGPVKIRVKHRSDPDNPEIKYTEVSRVTAA